MGFFNFFSSKKETEKQPQYPEEQLQLDLFANLSETQKFAMATMLMSLAAAPTSADKNAMVQKMVFTDTTMMGLTQSKLLNYIQTHSKSNSQAIISTLRTITDKNVLEWLIYSGFGIIAVNQNEKACSVYFDWWQQLGYEPEDIKLIVKKVETICNQINNL